MDVTFDGEFVHAGGQARERFYDARGYGQPRRGELALAPVEAAHLLFRGDLDAVTDARDGSQLGFYDFLAAAVSEVSFFVYKELRDRGFYLTPAVLDGGDESDGTDDGAGTFVVYPRGEGPWDETVAYRVRAVSERETVAAETLRGLADVEDATGVLAVVDEESEVTYLELDRPTITGSTHHDLAPASGTLLSDRVFVPDPPGGLHGRAFYGQRLDGDDDAVQLSLVEAASLAQRDLLSLAEGDATTLVERGRSVEGERFDRRLRAYSALRSAGIAPKTGFKFGADFRTYADVSSVEELGHSELLVRVLPTGHAFAPRDLALDVRLAHGVRKEMVFALTDTDEGIDWLSVGRVTP